MIREKCENKTDEELVLLALENQDFYECLVERYEEKLARYIRRISASSKEDVEDLLQEIFVAVYRNLNDFDSGLKFSSWIYRIAHNKTISSWRKTKSRPQMVRSEEAQELVKIVSSDEDMAKDLEKKFDSKQVEKILQGMDEKYREVLVLKFIEDKDYQEISDILKKPMGTVGTLIRRAKKQFRDIVEKENIDV
ncbi:MAG: RNA polymerase sigma factor [Candidatus Moranbacteria bacterium]|jgi:RNA polymerase sigma-70 factor (ECF subfamily)|nr:RNA polymerase sigma factor [Candidatus Moranbacteria bacterium]